MNCYKINEKPTVTALGSHAAAEVRGGAGTRMAEVMEWMTTADNYYLEYYGNNRSDGGKMTERYLPPVDNE